MTVRAYLHRFMAVALLGAAIAAAYFLVARPVLAHIAALEERLQSERRLSGRYVEALGGATQPVGDATDGKAASLEEIESAEPLMLSGSSQAVRAASLQAIVTGLAEEAAVRLTSTRVAEAQESGELALLGLEAGFEATDAELQTFLILLEAARPVLLLEVLSIDAPRRQTGSRRRDSGPPKLDVRLAVYAAEDEEPATDAGAPSAEGG